MIQAWSASARGRFLSFLTHNCEHFANWCVQGGRIPHLDGVNLTAGDHLVTKRSVYTHHGIYIGNGQVIHYAGFADGAAKGPVEKTTLEAFMLGKPTRIKRIKKAAYSRAEIVERASSRLGEAEYGLFSKNCEHFANWCATGDERSDQVRSVAAGGIGLGVVSRLIGVFPPFAGVAVVASVLGSAYDLVSTVKRAQDQSR